MVLGDLEVHSYPGHLQTPHTVSMHQSSSSSPTFESPTSTSMGRKRTLEMRSTGWKPSGSDGMNILVNAPPPTPHPIPAFKLDGIQVASSSSPYAGSVSTAASSPMVHDNSSQSFCASQEWQDELTGDEEEDPAPRPKTKKRKTAPTPKKTPKRRPRVVHQQRGNGKEGAHVWPAAVEAAFIEALTIVPKLGRKKILYEGKPCGRNELIGEYIGRKTGIPRDRKQVSSHIQVIKNTRKGDPRFMALISEKNGTEERFTEENALRFFGEPVRFFGEPAVVAPDSTPMMPCYSDNFLSPPAPPLLKRSHTTGSSPALHYGPSSLSESYTLSAPPLPLHHPRPISAPMSATSSLTHRLEDMHFPFPPEHDRAAIACPIAPASFCMWTDGSKGDDVHVYAAMEGGQTAAAPSRTVYLEDLCLFTEPFFDLVKMNNHLPCQFLHVRINLDVPNIVIGTLADKVLTHLKLTSLQDLDLTSVTRIYSHGARVGPHMEDLDAPTRIAATSQDGSISGSAHSSPVAPLSPFSDGPASPNSNLLHKYAYEAPFNADWWSHFLKSDFRPTAVTVENEEPIASIGQSKLTSFVKTGAERVEFAHAIAGLAVIQELVVRSQEPRAPLINGEEISPGSNLGDVVLVVLYDFEVREDQSAGEVEVSFLSQRRAATSPLPMSMTPSAPQLSRSGSLYSNVGESPPPAMAPPPPPTYRSHYHQKPNLSLHIPPLDHFAPSYHHPQHYSAGYAPSPRSGPITPWPQVIHTPNAPPPVHAAPHSSAQRERLEQHWARASTSTWAMDSPALMGAFPNNAAYENGLVFASASQAMGALTASANVVGTPLVASFPRAVQHNYGAPFVVHPSHSYAPEQEEQQSRQLRKMQNQEERWLSAQRWEKPMDKQEVKTEADAQDYFSDLLGSTKYA